LEEVKAPFLEKAGRRLLDPEITLVLKDFEKPYYIVGGEVASPAGSRCAAKSPPSRRSPWQADSKRQRQTFAVILYRRVGPDLAKTEILNLKAAISPTATEPLCRTCAPATC